MRTWRGGAAATWALPNRLFAALSTASSKGSTGGGAAGAGTAAIGGAGGADVATAAGCEAAGAAAAEVGLTGVGVAGAGDNPANPVQPPTNAVSTPTMTPWFAAVPRRTTTLTFIDCTLTGLASYCGLCACAWTRLPSAPFVINWTDANQRTAGVAIAIAGHRAGSRPADRRQSRHRMLKRAPAVKANHRAGPGDSSPRRRRRRVDQSISLRRVSRRSLLSCSYSLMYRRAGSSQDRFSTMPRRISSTQACRLR